MGREFFVSNDEFEEGAPGDYMGLDEILGGGIYAGEGTTVAHEAALARSAGGGLVRRREPSDFRRQPLPIPITVVAAGATSAAINIVAQRMMRIDGLRNPARLNGIFRITNVSINQEQQFVAQGSLPSDLFSEVAIGTFLRGATANLGSTVSITVQNFSAAPANSTYEGGYFGPVVM
jgi:hypothetical protein